MSIGGLVIVSTEGGKPGRVAHLCPNGMIGVALLNERGRVDEWNPSQVRVTTAKEAARAAVKFLNLAKVKVPQ